MTKEYNKPEFKPVKINGEDIITASQDVVPGSSGWETGGGEGGDVPFAPIGG